MSENTALWDILGRTDPAHTKGFTRGGGFKGTAIKPIWSYRRMTEEFGPCGTGWGVSAPEFQVVSAGDEILVYCTAFVWFKRGEEPASEKVYGVGGDKVVNKTSSGLRSDDEAFKKAYTDAITNALKMIGVGADVHMGLFDDSKYVASMRDEFADEKPAEPRKSSASLKRGDVWPEFERELSETSLVTLTKFALAWSAKAQDDGWPQAWREAAKEEINKRKTLLSTPAVDDDIFPGDRPMRSERNAYADNYSAG